MIKHSYTSVSVKVLKLSSVHFCEPLGVTSAVNANNRFSRSNSSDSDLESRMNNFRNLVSDLRSREHGNNGSTVGTNTYNSANSVNNRPSYYNPQSVTVASFIVSPVSSTPLSGLMNPSDAIYAKNTATMPFPARITWAELNPFLEDLFLKDVRNSKLNSRFAERTRV